MLWLALLVVLYSYFEAQSIKLRRDRIAVDGLPPAFDGLRIVHISDLHSAYFGPREERLCELLRNVDGDLVVFTGDYKSRKKTKEVGVVRALEQIVRCIRSPFGVLGVLGNKDNRGMIEAIERAGIEVLSNKTKRLTIGKDAIGVAGIDGLSLEKTTRALMSVTSEMPDPSFKILLSHTPDVTPLARALGYALILCGDTHGGQLRLPLLGAPVVKTMVSRRYCRGIIREGNSILCVSSGIGTCAFPLRFLCPPEVRVLTLVSGEERKQA